MVYDIKKINENFPNVHSRYFIDTNGVVYTSMTSGDGRIMVDGERISIKKFKRDNLPNMNTTTKLILPIPKTSNKYFMLNDGTILQRLKTNLGTHNVVRVCLITLDGNSKGNQKILSRLMAGSFLGNIADKEVHHKDGNRLNNKLSNLEILTFDEHRGKGERNKNHPYLKSRD
jgi:hypothetical protein